MLGIFHNIAAGVEIVKINFIYCGTLFQTFSAKVCPIWIKIGNFQ